MTPCASLFCLLSCSAALNESSGGTEEEVCWMAISLQFDTAKASDKTHTHTPAVICAEPVRVLNLVPGISCSGEVERQKYAGQQQHVSVEVYKHVLCKEPTASALYQCVIDQSLTRINCICCPEGIATKVTRNVIM